MRREALTFSYKKFRNFYKPVIPIELHYKHNTVGCLVLIDSGADNCIFRADIGRVVGIDIPSGPLHHIGGIASDGKGTKSKLIRAYEHRVGISVKGETRNITVLFSPDIADHGFDLVGQLGFFNMFESIKFSYNDKKVVIKP